MNNVPLAESRCNMPKDATWIFEGAAWGAPKTLRLNTLICQAQVDTADACRHSPDVVVQAGGGVCVQADMLLCALCPTYAHYATRLFLPGVQTAVTNRRGRRVVGTDATLKLFQHLRLNSATSVCRTLMFNRCYSNVSVSGLRLTLGVTSRPELD